MTDVTKKNKKLWLVFFITSFLLNVGPLAFYSGKALLTEGLTHQKVALTMTVLVVIILSLISFINKTTMRSKVWILLIGLYFVLDHFVEPLLLIAVTQVLDEWFISPLKHKYKNKYVINKEIDKR